MAETSYCLVTITNKILKQSDYKMENLTYSPLKYFVQLKLNYIA